MTREQAVKTARKRWGKQAYIRAGEHRSSPELREAAQTRALATKTVVEQLEQELKDKLAACDWYQDLTTRLRTLKQEKTTAFGYASYKKFAVGHTFGIGFMIEGQGDTWEEAFAEVDAKKAVQSVARLGQDATKASR